MPTVAVTQLIEASAVDVWRLLVDLPARADWLSTVGAVELLTPGRLAPGTTWRETRLRPDGSAQAEDFVVLEVVPSRRLVLSSPGIGVDYRITWTLRTVRRRCRAHTAVTVRQEATPTAPYGRVVALLFGGLAARAVEAAFRRDLADLARAARPSAPAAAA
ncbi:Polyketide cyclase / dehydrase and lipid transport [Micromonospora viridifaciens]|uniref:Polyketide cyclase / dehydrase and lipid transport n=1 Tax=Micromonospora viridifaciens TaxID=1881 RepID=A0A1C4URA5_MICVI|nr:SRPBCC family protein [Micromonospora viridifaciens]SCE74161.1 Polyketide cyclase / dehydrase and lipid transport [Micromonospora viridifaciens]